MNPGSHNGINTLCAYHQKQSPSVYARGFCSWRCRESNPGPAALFQGFSGRSSHSANFRLLDKCEHISKQTYLPLSVPNVPVTSAFSSGTLNDARQQAKCRAWAHGFRGSRLSSEGEIVARIFGNYLFAGIVNVISLHPRPASLEATTSVETDHPHVLFSNNSVFKQS